MKIKPRTQKDFEWVNWTPKQIQEFAQQSVGQLQKDIDAIVAIPKEGRTFENTVYALDIAGQLINEDFPVFVLADISTKESVRNAARKAREEVETKSLDILYSRELFAAFLEYDQNSEKLTSEEIRLYEDTKKDFERAGFSLPDKEFKKVQNLQKKLSVLSNQFSANITNYQDFILCTKEELDGLPDTFIANLEKDKTTSKYKVTLAYPEVGPFLDCATNEAKRKELADKLSQKGGKKNIALLKKMFTLRHELATLLGYKNFAEYTQETELAKKPKLVKDFLASALKQLKPIAKKEFTELQSFAKKELGFKEVNYYNVAFAVTKMQEAICGFNENEVKEYFEINHVLKEMMNHFGALFGVSFKENTSLKTWHKDVLVYDVLEKGKVLSHVMFDLYPREGKYSHMACAQIMNGAATTFRGKEYYAPVSMIMGNFPKGTKKSPSLLSFREIETLFHEFGHAMHGCLSHTAFASQSGTNVPRDFVEVPSQLFENWVRDDKLIKKMSKHYKTGKTISSDLISKILKSLDFRKVSMYYGLFILSFMDFEFHSTKYNQDPVLVAQDYNKKYSSVKRSPKSLFPASWGHLTGYAGRYYSYMWSLVFAYDIFSRFEKEGVYNKKVGKDLRKLLAAGDTKDGMDLMRDFLGREPDNTAFLKALGIEK